MPKVSGVYKITCIVSKKFYVGSSIDVHHRWYDHKNTLSNNRHENQYLQHAWNKHGSDNFLFELIEVVEHSIVSDREQYWLDELKPYNRDIGFNIAKNVYAPQTGRTLSIETKEKLSKALRGRKVSIETRAKISIGNTGKKKDAEMVERSASKLRGRKYTAVHRARIGAKSKGRKIPPQSVERSANSHRKMYIVINPDGEEKVIKGLSKFCREQGLDLANMRKVMIGKYKQHKGWQCRHMEGEI